MGFRDLLGKELLFFDGATGTMLQALGLQPGELPELWNFTHAAEVQSVHEAVSYTHLTLPTILRV